MPDLSTHTNVTAPAIAGAISSILAMLFDIQPEVLLVAFIGCWLGIAASKAAPGDGTHRSAAKSFLMTLLVVIICTIVTAYLIPIALNFFPDLAQKSVAAVIGFSVVKWHSEILDHASKAIGRLFGRIA